MITRLVFNGQPDWGRWDHTWYEDQQPKRCDGQPRARAVPARCGQYDQHPAHEYIGTVVVHVKRGEVVEVDLEDGSNRAAVMRSFMDRGFCSKVGPPGA